MRSINEYPYVGFDLYGCVNDAIAWAELLINHFDFPHDRRMCFLNPALRGDPVLRDPWAAKPKRIEKYLESIMKEMLISGCTDREYSHDARFGGVYHGAMTYFALQRIREANYKITYAKLIKYINHLLDQAGYPQHPQLEGSPSTKDQPIFI